MKRYVLVLILCLVGLTLGAQRLAASSQYASIQGAIDAATRGDRLLQDEATCYENSNFPGKAITAGCEYVRDEESSAVDHRVSFERISLSERFYLLDMRVDKKHSVKFIVR